MIKTWGPLVALIIAIGSTLVGVDSFYARRSWTAEQLAQVNEQYASQRLNTVDYQIIQLENDRRRRRLSMHEEDLLRRLYIERKQLLCRLRIERC